MHHTLVERVPSLFTLRNYVEHSTNVNVYNGQTGATLTGFANIETETGDVVSVFFVPTNVICNCDAVRIFLMQTKTCLMRCLFDSY